MNDLFSDHFNHPRNSGVIVDAQGSGHAGDPGCGVVIEFSLRFSGGRIDAASCQATGSSDAIACGSLLTEMVTGEHWRHAAAISEDTLATSLTDGEEARPSLLSAAKFAIEALHGALEDSLRRNTLSGVFPASDNETSGSILVAMSGGVDSSVACLMVRDSGREVLGITMRLWSDPECITSDSQSCCSPQAIRDAREVCHSLGLAHLTVDYTKAFAESVVDSFVDGYLAGITPNPCTFCNGSFRFPALLSLADRLGIAKMATGHYARIVDADGRKFIARAADETKDQTYMLWGINQSLLARLEFPLGVIRKDETRLIARKSGLKVHDRPESQEVCFIPDNDYRRFVRSQAIVSGKEELLPGEGDILDDEGARLGTHQGFIDYTVGQRHGLGVSAPEPLYVLRTFPEKNQVVAGNRQQLEIRHLAIRGVNSFLEPGRMAAGDLKVQVRYNSQPVAVMKMETGDDRWLIGLAEPAFGVAPGQSAVLYDEGVLLAGGVIEATA